MLWRTACAATLAVAIVLLTRALQPSDLYHNDQPRTAAYTVDIAQHGRWVLPKDQMGRWATKPPMVNWFGAVVAGPWGARGWWSELSLKLPSVLAGLGVLGLTVGFAAWLFRREPLPTPGVVAERLGVPPPMLAPGSAGHRRMAIALGLVAAAALVTGHGFGKLLYYIRPDMLVIFWVTAAWVLATLAVCPHPLAPLDPAEKKVSDTFSEGSSGGRTWHLALGYWACVGAAVLTKGAPAALAVAYAPLAAKLVGGRWRYYARLHPWWGLPLAGAMIAAWVYGVHVVAPEHLQNVLLGKELSDRAGRGGTLQVILRSYEVPVMILLRPLPWSLFFILALVHVRPSRWLRSPLGPCVLWVALCIALFSLSYRKRPDWVGPAFAAVSIPAAYWLVVVAAKYRVTPPRAAAVAVVIAVCFIPYRLQLSREARDGWGAHAVAFEAAVEAHVEPDAPVDFYQAGYNPLQPLLGRNQPTTKQPVGAAASPPIPPAAVPGTAAWIIAPLDAVAAEPVVASAPISEVHDGLDEDAAADRLGLFRRP